MRLPIAFLLLWTLAALITTSPAWAGTKTLARVDGEPLTGEDLQEIFGAMQHTGFLVGESEVRKALESLVERTLLLQEAERMDLGSLPEIQAGIDERLNKGAVKHLLVLEVEDPAKPTEEEIRAAYDRFTGLLLKVRQIVVPDRAAIDEIAALLKEDHSFAELAKERSRVKSAPAGGLMPNIGWGSMEAAWDDVAFSLEPGELSEPFASGGAWEILLLEERLPVEKSDYGKARSKIQGILLRRGLYANERDLSARLFKKYQVTVRLTPYDLPSYKTALERDPDTIVATWNGGALTIRELTNRIGFEPLDSLTAQLASRQLEELVRLSITRPLVLLEARARKYHELPEIREQAEEYRQTAMLAYLHNEFIFKNLEVTDDEVRRYYESHLDEIRSSEKRFVGQILVGTEEEARAAKKKLEEGTRFSDLAREISIDTDTAPKGGAIGEITKEQSPPDFQVVFSLAQGEVTEPIQSEAGWHLIRVLEIQPPRALSFEEVEGKIRKHLHEQKREQKRQDWLAQLRDAATVKIDDDAVRAFIAETAPAKN